MAAFSETRTNPSALLAGAVFAGAIDYASRHPEPQSLTIFADAEIHNTSELREKFGFSAAEASSDSQLILRAWEKWGENCGAFLLGEFSFVIWDPRNLHAFCCRDPLGSRAFLYSLSESKFAFAGDIRILRQIAGAGNRPNYRKLAALAHLGSHHLHDEETFHEGILSLPGGTCLSISHGMAHQLRYWRLGENPPRLPKQPAEVYQQLREILVDSVECRLQRSAAPVTTLSGGLDSSTVTAIAAQHRGSYRPLIALAGVVADDMRAQVRDEREFIDEFRGRPDLRIEYVTPHENAGPFDRIEDPPYFSATPFRNTSDYLYRALERAAETLGADAIFEGLGGELSLTGRGERHYVHMALSLRWRRLLQELRSRQNVDGTHPLKLVIREALDALSPGRQIRPWILLAPDFIREMQPKPLATPRFASLEGFDRFRIERWLRRHANRPGIFGDGTIRRATPLLDRRLLEFCLAMPADLKINGGYPRYPVRAALAGILPERIRWRTDKRPFSADYFIRYNRQLPKAVDFVAAIGRHDPIRRLIDVPALARLLRPVDPVRGSFEARTVVPATIYLISFLRQFAELRP